VAEPVGAVKFDRDTAVVRRDGSGPVRVFDAVVSPDWRAGRGPHGGYLAAMILRALTVAVDDPGRPPRSLTVHYARAPQSGPVTIEVTKERDGRSLSTLTARMEQDGMLIALVLAAFSAPWTAPEISEVAAPRVEPPTEPLWPGTPRHPLLPPIAHRSVIQPRFGGSPFAGGDGPMEVGGWIAHEEPRPLDALSLAFFADAAIPAPFMRLTEPNGAPTIDLNVHFRTALPPGEAATKLCLLHIRTRLIHEGFFEEDGLMWAPDGTLLAQSRQLALLLPIR
jgi:acyl-CoA thioesterase